MSPFIRYLELKIQWTVCCKYSWFKGVELCHSYSSNAVTFLIPLLGSCKLACHYSLGVRTGVPLSCYGGSRCKRQHTKVNWAVLGQRNDTFYCWSSAPCVFESCRWLIFTCQTDRLTFFKTNTLKVSAHSLDFLTAEFGCCWFILSPVENITTVWY